MPSYFVLWWLRQRSTCGISNATPSLEWGRCRVSGGYLGFVEIKWQP